MALLIGPAVSRPGRLTRPSAPGFGLMPPFVPSRTEPLRAAPFRGNLAGAETLRPEPGPAAEPDAPAAITAAVEPAPPQPRLEHEPEWALTPVAPVEAGASLAAASDRAWLDALDWAEETASPTPHQPSDTQERADEQAPERLEAGEVPAPGSAVTAEAPEFDLVVPGAALHDVVAEPLHDVADRLERIAGKLRRRAAGDLLSDAPNTDPLELLLTGFVLGYISQHAPQPGRRKPDAE